MPTYEEIIDEAHKNLGLLHTNLSSLNELKVEIEGLLEEPTELISGFKRLLHDNEQYAKSISDSVNGYLENSTALIIGLKQATIEAQSSLNEAASTLSEVNYQGIFDGLHVNFMNATKDAWNIELKKLEAPTTSLISITERLKGIVDQLEALNLQQELNKLKVGQSDIFEVLSLGNTRLDAISNSLESHSIDTAKSFADVHSGLELISSAIKSQSIKIEDLNSSFNKIHKARSEENMELQKKVKSLQTFSIVGLIIILIQLGLLSAVAVQLFLK